jgi:RNA polymerase sigma-70 factor (ECF subfamily)
MNETAHRSFIRNFVETEDRIRGYLLAICGDANSAEDLFQEVSCVLWEKFAAYDQSRPFIAWALGVARLECLKWREKQAKRKEILSPDVIALMAEDAAEEYASANDKLPALRKCIKSLKGQAAEIFRARYEENEAIGKIADRFDRSTGAVQMVLQRTRDGLRRCVEKNLKLGENVK